MSDLWHSNLWRVAPEAIASRGERPNGLSAAWPFHHPDKNAQTVVLRWCSPHHVAPAIA